MNTLTRLPRPLAAALVSALLGLVLLVSGATPASADGAAPPAGHPWGPDVSSYQHPRGASIDWQAVRSTGASFAIVKASEGTTYRNGFFRADWTGARTAGLVRGAYHFARPARPLVASAVAQAKAFVSVAGTTLEPGALPPILDLEVSGGLRPAELVAWATAWLDTAAQLSGRTPVIYTYPSFWPTAMGGSRAFGAYPLWLASYSATPRGLPSGWRAWTLWQSTSTGQVRGIPGMVDLSTYAGTPAGLARWASGRTAIQVGYGGLPAATRAALGSASGAEGMIAGGRRQPYRGGSVTWTPRTGLHAALAGQH